MDAIHLPRPICEAILAHAGNCLPDECCGLIASDVEGRVRFAYPLANADPSPVTYTIDPREHFHAMRHAEARGWQISGVFHSHPGGLAKPSTTDVRLALEPDWLYLVVSGDLIRGFRIASSRVEEVELA